MVVDDPSTSAAPGLLYRKVAKDIFLFLRRELPSNVLLTSFRCEGLRLCFAHVNNAWIAKNSIIIKQVSTL